MIDNRFQIYKILKQVSNANSDHIVIFGISRKRFLEKYSVYLLADIYNTPLPSKIPGHAARNALILLKINQLCWIQEVCHISFLLTVSQWINLVKLIYINVSWWLILCIRETIVITFLQQKLLIALIRLLPRWKKLKQLKHRYTKSKKHEM